MTQLAVTPMLKQYQDIKKDYPDCILFFRLGDFYEMFFDDAKKASELLDLVLTSRGKDPAKKIPMCGVPFHAADSYVAKLIKSGCKVAICEQVEDPAQAKGIVKRAVIRVITSGTFIDDSNVSSRYLMSLSPGKKRLGIAFTDTIHGTIQTNEFNDYSGVIEVIAKLPVFECVYPESQEEHIKQLFSSPLIKTKEIMLTALEDWYFNYDISNNKLCDQFKTNTLRGFSVDNLPQAICASGALLEYMKNMNQQPMRHIDRLCLYSDAVHMLISPAACYGLELEYLLQTLDKTITPMGKRLFRDWLYHPLKNKKDISERQAAILVLKESPSVLDTVSVILKNTPDLEKSLSRISCGYGNARDLISVRALLSKLPELRNGLAGSAEKNTFFKVNDVDEIRRYIEQAVNPDIPLSHSEGKIFNHGFNQEYDELKDLQHNGRQRLREIQEREVKKSGISSLKIGFNKVFGYYIEVSKANQHLVPEDYIRKQTLVNGERFITEELKVFEEKMLSAEEKLFALEKKLVNELFDRILSNIHELHSYCDDIARIDVLVSLARLAQLPTYVRPEIVDDTEIDIKDGRHPVVESLIREPFIPNDTFLDCNDNHLIVLTGPNMAGKSTYIRQIAILVIMAQMGSFVPAVSARIGIVDKIFTRIGAHDEITKGQSTFMVEMSETAGILNNLSARSLVILDEIGRGTSTYDGLSLAWAVAEFLQQFKIRTLFATHFHEITALAEQRTGVKNFNVSVKEWNDEVVFLHKIVLGGTDDSYGIYVAKLAGIPVSVVERSKEILNQLEFHGNLQEKIRNVRPKDVQLSFFSHQEDRTAKKIKESLSAVDCDNLTPLEALKYIHDLKEMIEDHEKSTRTST